MDWYEVYLEDIKKKKTIENYIMDKIKFKKPLINLVKKYASNRKVLEAGSGTGVISTYISSLDYDVTAIDIDTKMIQLSTEIADKYNTLPYPKFVQKSIFELNYDENKFDVSFSNGVLEHFSDEEIINTLSQQMRISKIVIFGIPTKYFNKEEAMYGDERYMSFSTWRKLIKRAGGIILEEKSMQYMKLRDRVFNFKKWFKPAPFRIFVIRREK